MRCMSNAHTGSCQSLAKLCYGNSFASDVGPWIAFNPRECGPFDLIPDDDTAIVILSDRHQKELSKAKRSKADERLEQHFS